MSSQWIAIVTDAMDQKTVSSEIAIPGSVNASQPDAWAYFRGLGSYFQAGTDGAKSLRITVQDGAVSASGTVTLSSSVATDTVTINGTVFTEVASGATNNQFNHGASDTITATNLAAAINSSTTANVNQTVTATSAGPVVTVTSLVPGVIGNLGTLAISAHGSVSGANLTGGSSVGQGTLSEGV